MQTGKAEEGLVCQAVSHERQKKGSSAGVAAGKIRLGESVLDLRSHVGNTDCTSPIGIVAVLGR